MPNRFGHLFSSSATISSISAGDVYLLAGGPLGAGSTSWTSPTSVSLTGLGDGWTDEGQAIAVDGSSATTALSAGAGSATLLLSGFGFSIPDSIVTSVDLQVTHGPSGGTKYGGVYVGSTALHEVAIPTIGTPATYLDFVPGGLLTSSQVNSSNFGYGHRVFDSGTYTLDGVKLRINYLWVAEQTDSVSQTLPLRLHQLDLGIIAAGKDAGEGSSEVELIIGSYNVGTALTSVGTTTALASTSDSTVRKPRLYRGTYSDVVSPTVLRRFVLGNRAPVTLEFPDLVRLVGGDGTLFTSGADVPFVGLRFLSAISTPVVLTALSEV